ncbi:cytochrome P450 [Phyllobacterium phragmitis]|nr:cytochrome P450 [Phyllobacterium phragmitis]
MTIAVFPDLSSEAFFADRYFTYRVLREKFPFFRTEIDGEPCILLTRYADVDDILRHPLATIQSAPDDFPEKRIGQRSAERFYHETFCNLDVLDSLRLHRAVAPAFTPQAVAKMRGWMKEVIERHLARLDDETEIDFIAAFVSPVTDELAGRLLHVPAVDAGRLLRRSHDLITIICTGSPVNSALAAPNEAMRLYFADIDNILRTLGTAKLPENDFIGLMLAAAGKDIGMIHSEIVSAIAGFIATAYHTMKSTIVNATLALLRHPDQKIRLIAQPDLARSAWEETLRFDGPVHFIHRFARHPIVIGGVPIEPGLRLVLSIQSANRDELQFSNPDRFIIARPNNGQLGFDGGPHFDWGAQVARLGGELLMQRLFQRFPKMYVKEVQTAPAGDISFPALTRLDVSLR